jgi:peroxiredoxin family protein
MSLTLAQPPAELAALNARVDALEAELAQLRALVPEDRATILVFSGDLDRLLAAFLLATGAAALGHQTTMFFSFWGVSALRVATPVPTGKAFVARLFSAMLPGSAAEVGLSRLHFLGAGTAMIKRRMVERQIADLPTLIRHADALGVEMLACETSMDLMGLTPEELRPGVKITGVTTCVETAGRSRLSMVV